MKKRKTYTPQQKAAAVMRLLKGEKTVVELSRELDCHPNVIGKWKETFLARAENVFTTENDGKKEKERVAELERMVGKLTVQNDFLKKVSESIR